MWRKQSIMIIAAGDSSWIGGLYYKKNVIFMLTQSKWICNHYKLIVVASKSNKDVFDELSGAIRLINMADNRFNTGHLGSLLKTRIFMSALFYGVKYMYPFRADRACELLRIRDIIWVPDFQDCVYPQFFTERELSYRNNKIQDYYRIKIPIVLSSHASESDLYQYYGKPEQKVYVLPFVSYIEKEARALSDSFVRNICVQYGLAVGSYIIVCNQFWPHKNHRIILDALQYIEDHHQSLKCRIVFTGKLPDEESVYGNEICDRIRVWEKKGRVKLIGFTERLEQLALMKGARLVLQPSLFEGWGTVLEDAKVLDKTVLLSDIPVHREQKNENCMLFNPESPEELAELLIQEEAVVRNEDVERGIQDMYARASIYIKGFEQMLFDHSKRNIEQ